MLTALKLFVRTLSRKKLFSTINIVGLTIGFLCTTLIYLYVQNELNYDQFHSKGDRIYRINQTFIWGEDNPNQFSSTGPGVAHAISEEIPDVEQVVKVHEPDMMPIRFKMNELERFFNDEYVLAADSNFFEVFSYPLLHGDQSTALSYPNSVVITEQVSKRFFGDEEAIGKIIDMGGGENRAPFKVTGVVAETKENTYIEFDMLISLNSIDRVGRSNWSWMWTQFETFVVLNENSSPDLVKEKLQQLPEKYAIETLEMMGYTYEEYIEAGKEWNLYMQPFVDIHLHSDNVINRINTVGNYKVVAALIGSAIFVIMLSCINFVNLSTSQFTAKAKNAALRKILGSSKAALRRVYFSEALIFCMISVLLSVALTYYLLPFFNQMVGMELSFSLLNDPSLVLFLIVVALAVSSLAGLYPAIFFSRFKPVSAMKGELKSGKSSVGLRNGMMVVQYTLSLLLIMCSLIVYQQLKHVFNSDLGFKKENLITVNNVHWTGIYWESSPDAFVEELRAVDGVTNASFCDATPLMVYNGDQFMTDQPDAGGTPLNYALGDENYIDLLELEVVVGRGFDRQFSDDVNGIVLNETAIRNIGWEVDESVLNRKISNWSGEYHIIGVLKDFNYWSIQSPIEPFALFHSSSNAQGNRPVTKVALSVESSSFKDFNKAITGLEAKWKEFAPNRPFEYTIIDQVFASTYESEARFGKIISSFAFLTILIATLGLLGMVIFNIEQKTKEIGIRKVLGGSVLGIASLFTKGYVRLLIIAFMIAVPIGYNLMNNWLGDFEYRIEMSPWTFVISGVILLIVSISISSYHSIKASMMNPASVLKDE